MGISIWRITFRQTAYAELYFAVAALDGIHFTCDSILRQVSCVKVDILQAQVNLYPEEGASLCVCVRKKCDEDISR